MKTITVRTDYAQYNKELGHTQANMEPVIFVKPDFTILKNNKSFFIPDFSKEIYYEAEPVTHVDRLGKSIVPRFADRYYDAVTVGIDPTARDLQRKFRERNNPWELCKDLDSSVAIGIFVLVEHYRDIQNPDFHLLIDGKEMQRGCAVGMFLKIGDIIAYINQFAALKIGDLLLTGTPVGVGPVSIGQCLQGYLEGEELLDFYIC